jgi:hypothetical protein
MGQYAGQPDFATRAVAIGKSDDITPDKFLDGAAIYVGAGGNLNVIMAGTVGATTVVDLVSSLYSGSNGDNYTTAAAVLTQGGSTGSSGLKVDIVADASGVITSITINDPGTGYQNGDLISPIQGGNISAVFKVVTENAKPTSADAVLFDSIQDGSFTPIIVDYVLSTGTTAGKLVAVY